MDRKRVLRRTGEAPAVRVYTVCDESRYLVIKNVPALGCSEELVNLFGAYGPIEEFKLLDNEEREPFTDVYWMKYADIANARLAKRKLDDYKFLANLLQVTYAPQYETLSDTKDKLEERRLTVLNRKAGEYLVPRFQPDQYAEVYTGVAFSSEGERCEAANAPSYIPGEPQDPLLSVFVPTDSSAQCQQQLPSVNVNEALDSVQPEAQFPQTVTCEQPALYNPRPLHFPDPSMNEMVHYVRGKLDKVSQVPSTVPSYEEQLQKKHSLQADTSTSGIKKARNDNRRRI